MSNQGSVFFEGIQNGSPTGAGARNGLSADASGYAVLGNDTGGTDADLLSDRAINMDEFLLTLRSGNNIGDLVFNYPGSMMVGIADANRAPTILSGSYNVDSRVSVVGGRNNNVGTSARMEFEATNDANNSVFFGVGSQANTLYPDAGYIIAPKNFFYDVTAVANAHLFRTNSVERLRIDATNVTSHRPVGIIADALGFIQPDATDNVTIGFDFKNRGGTTRGYVQYNGTAGFVKLGGASGYRVELWANDFVRINAQVAGSILFMNEGGATAQEFALNGDIAMLGALTTGNPSGGSGSWRLGTVKAGAVALDAANYVEVKIDGVLVKLLKAA